MLIALIAAAIAGSAPQTTSPDMWDRAGDYVRLEGPVVPINVRIELTVDENGEPVHCSILQSNETKGFEDRFCLVPMRRAHFKPARDENGMIVTGVFSTNFRSRAFSHGVGPDWSTTP